MNKLSVIPTANDRTEMFIVLYFPAYLHKNEEFSLNKLTKQTFKSRKEILYALINM